MDVQPALEIRPGYKFNVLVDQGIVFPGSSETETAGKAKRFQKKVGLNGVAAAPMAAASGFISETMSFGLARGVGAWIFNRGGIVASPVQ